MSDNGIKQLQTELPREQLGLKCANGDPARFGDKQPVHRGRPVGSRNRVSSDLMDLVLLAAEQAGYMRRDDAGHWVATGEDGLLGYLRWIAVNRPERLIALMSHGIPKQVHANVTPNVARTVEEIDAELRERGLPVELLEHLRMMPDVLQEGEDPDPYGLLKDVTPDVAPDDTAK
jgi:hypothetical protein